MIDFLWWRSESSANPSHPISLFNRENTGNFPLAQFLHFAKLVIRTHIRVSDEFKIVAQMEIGSGLFREAFAPSGIQVSYGEEIHCRMRTRHCGAKSANSPRANDGDANLFMAHA